MLEILTQIAAALNPLLSIIAMVALAIYSKRETARRDAAKNLVDELGKVRTRTHDLVSQMQRLPSVLKDDFVARGEWEQAERSADHIHATMNNRLAALEARR